MSELRLKEPEDFWQRSQQKNNSVGDAEAVTHGGAALAMQQSSLSTANELSAPFQATQPTVTIFSPHERLVELESENIRLQRLVAELLLKNQRLRSNS